MTMKVFHNNVNIEILGDPHLGRKFVNGVPLGRRGEREAMVWADFEKSIRETKADYHVCMGDLFDKAVVSYDTVLRAARVYREAVEANPVTKFVILRGNHDAQRDLERASAFDLFFELARDERVIVVRDTPLTIRRHGLTFYPWHPTTPAAVYAFQVPEVNPKWGKPTIAFGHWDVEDFGNENPNLVPARQLKELGYEVVYTGHDHKRRTETIDGLTVEVVGSMQPYAHGEESDDSLYVTASLPEVAEDPSKFKDKCLRVLLEPGEVFDVDVDYLALVLKRIGANDDEDGDLGVEIGTFDLDKLFAEAFAAEEVGEEVAEIVFQSILDRRVVE